MRNKLKIMRKKQDLTQIELADKVNVSRKTVIDIENAKTNPSIIISLKLENIMIFNLLDSTKGLDFDMETKKLWGLNKLQLFQNEQLN